MATIPITRAWAEAEHHGVRRIGWSRAAHLMVARKQRDQKRKCPKRRCILQSPLPVMPFLQQALPPSFYHRPIMPSNY
jgi:hypothetical protein